MLRSFHYAPYAVVFGAAPGSYVRTEDLALLETGARFWHQWVGAAFLRAYMTESASGSHLPRKPEELDVLLQAYLIEKAMYEIVYELNNRPEWVRIPLRGVLDLLD
jgi:maltose alpha-D-glucosyltransferase/alpha-amylase